MKEKKIGVLFVCLGNICRSPSAEGVFSKMVKEAGLEGQISIDSAGTSNYHEGEMPDLRAQAEAKRRGVDISGHRARQIRAEDFEKFDYIIAMDRSNYRKLKRQCPREARHRLHMMMDFAPEREEEEVPDPYYGGLEGFAHVFDLLEVACQHLLNDIRRTRLGHG